MTRTILWSGGFDSTALVLDALHRGDTVVPVVAPMGPGWQKTRREQAARERIRAGLPAGLRGRLGLVQGDVTTQQPFWYDYDRIHAELLDRQRTRGLEKGGCSDQIPMLLAVAQHFPTIEAGFVAGDAALDREFERAALFNQIRLPLCGMRKAELLAQATTHGYAHLLRMTWSCEGDDVEAQVGPCGLCDPCRARIIPAPWVPAVELTLG